MPRSKPNKELQSPTPQYEPAQWAIDMRSRGEAKERSRSRYGVSKITETERKGREGKGKDEAESRVMTSRCAG
jgi:hypothetical protein